MMRDHFAAFARYNRWANERLYAAAGALPDAEYRADRGAYFRSLHGTLNHVLVADRLWLGRIVGDVPALTLDQILCDDLPGLTEARRLEDERLATIVAGLDDERLGGTLAYRSVGGGEFRQPLAQVLAHVFNHQTHHRGQAHAILTGLGREAPSLDLAPYLRETAAAAA